MRYGYRVWKDVEQQLRKEGVTDFRVLREYNDLTRLVNKGVITSDHPLIMLGFSQGERKLQRQLTEQGYALQPNPAFSDFIERHVDYLPEVDKGTAYPLTRCYTEDFREIPSLIEKNFPSDASVILKAGNLHASEGKWLIGPDRVFPRLKPKYLKLSFVVEEFVPDARSIRVGVVGEPENASIFITEHINHKTWLKNNDPDEELTYSYEDRMTLGIPHIDSLIEETKQLALRYNTSLIGVDWVVSPVKTGLLELNDMIGLPEGDFALGLFTTWVKKYLIN